MIFAVTIITVLGHHEPWSYKAVNLIHEYCITAPLTSCYPISLPFLGPPYSMRHNNIEIKPVKNPAMAFKCSSERRVTICHLKSKARNHQAWWEKHIESQERPKKARHLASDSQVVPAKGKFLKEMKSATSVSTGVVRKENSLIADVERVWVTWIEDQTSRHIPGNQSLIQNRTLTGLPFCEGWEKWGSCRREVRSQQGWVHEV